MVARKWNHLPEIIKSIENYNVFAGKLKALLLQCMFYDMQKIFSCTFELCEELWSRINWRILRKQKCIYSALDEVKIELN